MNFMNEQNVVKGRINLNSKEPEIKRIFGKDITNLSKKLSDNIKEGRAKGGSLYEMQDLASKEEKPSSFLMRKQNVKPSCQNKKDPVEDHYQNIMQHMIDIQVWHFGMQKSERIDLELQSEVNDKMRQILVDWIIDVHDSFELKEQTLYLALSYMNGYQNSKEIKKDEYQLFGITCLWIASKYQEIYPPRMKSFIQVTADTYTTAQIKAMEGKIIEALEFNLNRVTSLNILELVGIVDQKQRDEKHISLCKYAFELSLLEGKIPKKYSPLMMGIAAVLLADSIYKTKTEVKVLREMGSLQKEDIYKCYKEMCLLFQQQNKYGLTAVKRKFGKQKHHKVSKIKISGKSN